MTIYTSENGHYSLERAADTLGLGLDSIRRIRTDAENRMDPYALAETIDSDIRAGMLPMCVAATAGNVSTGNVDPLNEIADVCAERNVWFHVDAAYGGAVALSEKHSSLLQGIERADSITLDPHKWLFIPFTTGTLLVREEERLKRNFEVKPNYIKDDDPEAEFLNYYQYCLQGSRRFDALKLWMALKHLGRSGYAKIIDGHMALAKELEQTLADRADFEVKNRVELAIVCCRYVPHSVTDPELLDSLQASIQKEIEKGGQAWMSTTTLRGRKVLRVNIESYHTTKEDVSLLVDLLDEAGKKCAAQLSS